MTNHRQQHSEDLEQVLIALEDAWVRERSPDVVEEFARKYPDFADDLYGYFDSLLSSEIRSPNEASVDDGTREALRRWFESEGRQLARSLAVEERRALGRGGETSTPASSGVVRPDAARAHDVAPPQSDEPGPAVESLIGYLKKFAGRSIVTIADELKATPAFLRLIAADPPSVPESVKRELAGLASERLGVPAGEVLERLSHTGSYPMAASRDQPYSGGMMTFDRMLEASGLSDDQLRFWTQVARGGRPREG